MRLYARHLHKSDVPWDHCPFWAFEIREMLVLVLDQQEKQMAAIDDLNTAVAGLVSAVETFIAKQPPAGTPDSAIEAAVSTINAEAAKVTAATPA